MFQHEFHVKWSNTSQQPDKARILARSIVFYNDICEMLLLANVFQIADPKSRRDLKSHDLKSRDFDLKSRDLKMLRYVYMYMYMYIYMYM